MYMNTPRLLGLGPPGSLIPGSPGIRSSHVFINMNVIFIAVKKHKRPKTHMLACLHAWLPACSPDCFLVCLSCWTELTGPD